MVGVEPSSRERGVRNTQPNAATTIPVKNARKKPLAAIFSALAMSCAPNLREM